MFVEYKVLVIPGFEDLSFQFYMEKTKGDEFTLLSELMRALNITGCNYAALLSYERQIYKKLKRMLKRF